MIGGVRAIRGAVQVERDSSELIGAGTRTMLREILGRNGLESEDLISGLFTVTTDLTSCFPAACARELGLDDVPLMCATEVAVPGAMPRVVRVLLHAYTARRREDIRHVYLGGAAALRPDLATRPARHDAPTRSGR
jgi:chorismate mutase